jgi:hypothetical protein
MPNVLQEYLVKLGFQTDSPSLSQFNNILVQAEATVTRHVGGMTKKVLEAQGAIVGAFTGISTAIIGLVDKTAMADQSYRLLGLRMMMTTDSARKMDMITKALGADLDQIVWDPELHGRAVLMAQDISNMTKALGPDFEQKMLGIRNIRFEFSRLGVALKFLGMSFAEKLFEKLMPGEAGDRIKRFVDWFESKIPNIAETLATRAVPILKETWGMIKGIGEVLKAAGAAFSTFVGLLSGDTAIQSATFSFENLLKSIVHIEHGMVRFFGWITNAEKLLANFATGVGLLLSGNFAGAGAAFGAGMGSLTGGSGALLGAVGGSGLAGVAGGILGGMVGGPVGAFLGSAAGGAIAGPVIGGAVGYGAGKLNEAMRGGAPSETGGGSLVGGLAAAIARYESGGNPNALNFRNNNPGNLRSWGSTPVVGGFAQFSSPEAGAAALQAQITKNINRGLSLNEFFGGGKGYVGYAPSGDKNNPAAYAAWVAKQLGIDPNTPLNQIASSYMNRTTAATATQSSSIRQDVHIGLGGIYITQPGADAQTIQRAVADGVRDGLNEKTRTSLAQLQPAWG